MKLIITLITLALAAGYWLTPAHVLFQLGQVARAALIMPSIICANSVVSNELPNLVQAFDPSERLSNDAGPGAGRPGDIMLANEGRFESSHFSEPLTAFSVGWLDKSDIKATLDRIAPEVTVARRFEYKKAANAESFLSETDDVRAIGADFKRVEVTGTSVNEKTLNKGLTMSIDHDEMLGDNWQERYTTWLMQRLFRNELRRSIAVLSAASANTNVTWDVTAGKDPDFDLLGQIEASGDVRGIDANLALFGSTSWRKRSMSHRAQNSAGGFASASLTPAQLAELLGLDDVIVSKERYQSSASAKSQIVANKVIIYYAMQGITKDDPSDIKRFVSPTEGGGNVRVYVQEVNAKRTDITVEHYSQISTPANLGEKQLTVS
jgi:hypothetical protein